MKTLNKILIIRSGAIGDVLMTTPLVRGLRAKFPKAHISYLVGRWSHQVLDDNKYIDEIIVFDDKIIFKKKLFPVLKLIQSIRKKRFDLCLILDKSYLWNIFALLCGISKRYGFNRGWEGFSNTKNVVFNGSKYELEYYLDVGKLLGIKIKNKKMYLKQDKEYAKQFILKEKIHGKIIGIGAGGAINPGQKAIIKRWSFEKYAKLVDILANKWKYNILLFGDGKDFNLNNRFNRLVHGNGRERVWNVAGIHITESAALADKCKYFITHDGGLLNIAATTKTKVIAIFGPTSEERFAPRNAKVIKSVFYCSPCYNAQGKFKPCVNQHDCMEWIKVDDILKVIK